MCSTVDNQSTHDSMTVSTRYNYSPKMLGETVIKLNNGVLETVLINILMV